MLFHGLPNESDESESETDSDDQDENLWNLYPPSDKDQLKTLRAQQNTTIRFWLWIRCEQMVVDIFVIFKSRKWLNEINFYS